MNEERESGVISRLVRRIENYVGLMLVPVGEVRHFVLNGRETKLIMATWERTVVAGASKAAKLARPDGFTATARGPNLAVAQVVVPHGPDTELCTAHSDLSDAADEAVDTVVRDEEVLGEPRCSIVFLDGGRATKIEVSLDAGNRMGAARASSFAERLAHEVMHLTGLPPLAAICSNENAGVEVLAKASWPVGTKDGISEQAAERMLMMQSWAQNDSSRASTNNKGIMNGICAVARATGQDIEAIQAAVASRAHPYGGRGAAPLAVWYARDDRLHGELLLRIPVGVEGGATELFHAVRYRKMMDIETADELAEAVCVAGLLANFAALHCLVNEGIVQAARRTRNKD